MTARAIHQVVVGSGRGDAITSMAITLRDALRLQGPSEIYAQYVADDVAGDVRPLTTMARPRRGDLIVYHASFGEPQMTRFLLSRPERLVLCYHNITPSQFFLEHEPNFAANLQWGRHELTVLRDKVVLALAYSQFNAGDLVAAGYSDVRVVPAGLNPSRLSGAGFDSSLARRLRAAFPNGYVLSVSQSLPHKRFESLIEAMHLVQWVHELKLGLVIVGTKRMLKYQQALEVHAARLRVEQVLFHGTASERELATFFQQALMYVSTSAHEGLALPPLEAMSFGVPVIARSAGALADTIGGAGLVLPADAGPMMLSEAIAEVSRNDALRWVMKSLGAERVRSIESDSPSAKFIELVGTVR